MSLKRCGPLQRFEVQQELTQQIRQPPLPVTLQAYQRPQVRSSTAVELAPICMTCLLSSERCEWRCASMHKPKDTACTISSFCWCYQSCVLTLCTCQRNDAEVAFTGWQPQGSAWKRYIAQASDAAAAFKGFGLTPAGQVGQAQPAASAPPELPSGQAAGLPDEPARPVPSAGITAAQALSPRGLFPAQLSLERLQTQLQAPMRQHEDGMP